ncbi:extracellular solute-binding protein [Isosphaeraceae bacterium EP7]
MLGMRSVALVSGLLLALVLESGCGGPAADEPGVGKAASFKGVKLVVGMVGAEGLKSAVEGQRGEWAATRGAEVSVRQEPVDLKVLGGVDLLIFPGERLGDLVDAGVLAVIPDLALKPRPRAESESTADPAKVEETDSFKAGDLIPVYRDQVTHYGADRFALPLGGTGFVLVMNRAALDSEASKAAASSAKVELAPPATWSQLDALAAALNGKDWSGDGQPDFGIALALGDDTEGTADALFLARAAAAGQHRDQYSYLFESDTMVPRVASPPFVEAMAALVKLAPSGPPGMNKFDAKAARAAFAAGNVAMLVDRAERASEWGDANAIAVAPLPGSSRVYDPARKAWESTESPNQASYLPDGGGWLVGVAAKLDGPSRVAALDFALFLAGPDTTNRLRADRVAPQLATRNAQLRQGLPNPRSAPGVDARQWAEAVEKTLRAPRVLPGLRIHDAAGYLSDLTKGRLAALAGTPADKALAEVSASWDRRTDLLGRARQVWHYRRTLNTLETAAQPPAR